VIALREQQIGSHKSPEYLKAVEKEQFERDVAFLGFPETVCGVEFRPLTLADVLLLRVVGSPFVVGGRVGPLEVGAFFKLQCTTRSRFARWLMLRKLGKSFDLETTIRAIQAFIEEAYADAPGVSGHVGVSYYSSAAGAVDCLAAEYGWTPDVTMAMPLRVLFQYYKVILSRLNPTAPLLNPKSDRVRREWLEESNKRN
jgi:hypothetical protein